MLGAAVNPPADDPVQAEVSEFSRRERAIRELARKRALLLREGGELPETELRFLKSTAPPCDSKNAFRQTKHVDDYLLRVTGDQARILGLQQAAGTPSDRQADVTAAEAAQAERDAVLPEQQAIIAAAQEIIDAAEKKAANARRAVDRRLQAVRTLRDEKLLPPFIVDRLQSLRRRHIESHGRELVRLRSRIPIIETICGWNTDTDGEQIRLHVEANADLGGTSTSRLVRFFESRHYTEDDQRLYDESLRGNVRLAREFFAARVRTGEWRRYVEQLRQEAESTRARIAELEILEQAAADEIQELLNYHVPS